MYFLLILFFGSLVGIIFMIGRKLATLTGEPIPSAEEIVFDETYWNELKIEIIKDIKKWAYLALVAIVRFYVYTTDFLKKEYALLKNKIQSMGPNKQAVGVPEEKKENKFLKMISDYKYKVRKIRYQIKREKGEENS
jgi:hypothetical protein